MKNITYNQQQPGTKWLRLGGNVPARLKHLTLNNRVTAADIVDKTEHRIAL